MKKMTNFPLINILTRTSNRPNYFYDCFVSVHRQTYKNYRQIVCVDNDASREYVQQYGFDIIRQTLIQVDHLTKRDFNHAPYNLYLNDLLAQVKDGWVMILDDDDMFYTDRALGVIAEAIRQGPEDNLILWNVQFPNKIIPERHLFGKPPVECHISMIGFCFHISMLKELKFNDSQTGDFTFINHLYKQTNRHTWIRQVLTGLQRTDVPGGFGSQKDKQI